MTTIRFSLNPHPGNWLVALGTLSLWGHVDFILDSGELLCALPGVGVTFRKTPTDDLLVKHVRLPTDQGIQFALSQLGKPYDWAAALAIPLGRDWQNPDAWFCSELVAASLVHAGLLSVPHTHKVTPGYLNTLLSQQHRSAQSAF